MIYPGHSNPAPIVKPDGTCEPAVKYDVGVKFARLQYEVRPVVVVEAKPKIKYVYGKKVLYLDQMTFRNQTCEMYDKQMKLWKVWLNGHGHLKNKEGHSFSCSYYTHWYDFQTDHLTRLTNAGPIFNPGATIGDYTLKKLLEIGR